MVDEGFKRKLAAILSADVEGYSQLMDDHEEATVRTLTTYRSAINDLVQQYRGRVVDTPGDNILAEFTSVVDAVNCAVEIQRELAERNAELPYNRKMEFRIGVNLGDVIEEEGQIYGDGVNIAARVEAMAEAGGICISGRAFDQVENKLGLEYENLGEHQVKNIARAIRVYRVLSFPGAAAHRVIQAKEAVGRKWRNIAIVAGAATLAVLIAVGIWQFNRQQSKRVEAASIENMAHPLPDKPSFAVLPFVNVSKEPDLEYLCDGLTETLISILSKNPWIFVIASNSSFTYKGKPVKIHTVAEELGVQYVIEGSVQKSGDRLRITAQLIDALTGRHTWSERFDRSLKDLFKLQDEIVLEILKSPQIADLEIGKKKNWFVRGGTNNIDAHLKFLEGMYNHRFRSENHLIKAKQLFEEAIAMDPDFVLAHTMLSIDYHYLGRYYSSGETSRNNLEKGLELAKKAIELDNSVSDAHAALGTYYTTQKKHDMAIAEYKKAIELDPAHPWNHAAISQAFLWIYRLEESVYHQKEAMRLNPFQPVHYLDLGRAYFHLRQYEDAIRMHKKVIELMQRAPIPPRWPHLHIAMVYSELGRDEEASAHMKKVLEFYPKFNLERRRKAIFFKDPANTEREIEALRKAGAPEHPPSL